MDGSSLSLIMIPIVVSISLAAWLVVVYYADSHPRWGGRRAARGPSSSLVAATADDDPSPDARPSRQTGREGSEPQLGRQARQRDAA
jgi:hypothetical protein